MRYYTIAVSDPTSGQPTKVWSSQYNGAADPGAHQVEFDVLTTAFDTPIGASSVTIWGVRLEDISQSSDFNGKSIAIYGGMQKGLPLANPTQAGLLISGTILQAFGNWIGTEMSLCFVFAALSNSKDNPANIVVNWKAGTQLSTALDETLARAFPKFNRQINISPNLVLAHDEVHYCWNIEGLASFLSSVTLNMLGNTYQGVRVTVRENTIIVYDGTNQTTPVSLLFSDLVGQPTWYDVNQASITTVMRADIHVGDYIRMPEGFVSGPGSVMLQPQTLAQYPNRSAFQGTFQVKQVRHVGNFRDPDGRAWVSIFNCAFPVNPS